jgi:tyrosyl-tRNA synthetase
MNTLEKLKLLERNTKEILGKDQLKSLIASKKKPSVYLGTSITGSPHAGYFFWAMKLADFAKAGLEVKLLLADLHGALDNTPWNILEKRYKYYERLMPLLFKSLKAKPSQIKFIKGSSFQLSKSYFRDLLKLKTVVSIHDATKAASEVVKLGNNPKLAGITYPLMQALDEEYLKVDIQYGGIDQRKIFVLASENLPKIGYRKRVHIMTPIVPGLVGDKMSSSDNAGKIDLLDSAELVSKKIKNATCTAGNPNNGVMAFLKYIIIPLKQDNKKPLIIRRDNKYGGDLSYLTYEQLESDFKNNKVHPLDVKLALAKEINFLLEPIRKDKLLKKLYKVAYS